MKNIVFDADSLIKLAYAGIFVYADIPCMITRQVYTEAVIEGKKKQYPDAMIIEQLVESKRIIVKDVIIKTDTPWLGVGEASTLALFRHMNLSAIVSDDKKFLAYLDEITVPFMTSTDYLLLVFWSGFLNKKQAREILDNMRYLVNDENYNGALDALGGRT